MTARPRDTDFRNTVLVAAIGFAVYFSLRSINYDSNGIVTAKSVEAGLWAGANHMVFELVGSTLVWIAAALGWNGPSVPLLQLLVALAGGITLGAVYLAGRRMGSGPLPCVAAVIWLGAGWAFWKWSTEVAYIMTAAMFSALAVATTWRKTSGSRQIVIGVLAALAILAWQANIFLVPALLLSGSMRHESRKSWIRHSALLLIATALTLAVAYSAVAYALGARDPHGAVHVLTSYGGGANPTWGHWGRDRIAIAADTWIHSVIGWVSLRPDWFLSNPVRFNTVFPRLAPYAALTFLAVPLWRFFRRWTDAPVIFSLVGVVSYLPFVVWWDPWETKWLLTPNLFVALLCARLWSVPASRFGFLAVSAALIVAVSNLSLSVLPAHTKLSAEYRVGDCVGEHLGPADLFLASDWAFGDYMSYKHRHLSMDLISTGVGREGGKTETLQEIQAAVRKVQASGNKAYIPDPLLIDPGRLGLLKQLTGITSEDLDQALPGRLAFQCETWPIREIEYKNE